MKNKSVLQLERDDQTADKRLSFQSHATELPPRPYTTRPRVIGKTASKQPMALWRLRIVALLRVLCGGFCLGDVWFKWHASFADTYLLILSRAVGAHTPIAANWFAWWLHVAQLHTQAFVVGTLLLELCLGICLICGLLTNLSCLVGMFLTLLGCMGTGMFAGFFGQGSLDVGVLVVFLLAFLGLILSRAGQYVGLDHWLRPSN
ncbi:DoxX family protein [Dictyobacter kobayashii]|uniref:DoxX family protein n=1 Tax=Dictyobacter kobayashii TaxID=2014872 RepID=UPI000F8299A0|nr:DoxX family protein [Dictyobacter kobayashii]